MNETEMKAFDLLRGFNSKYPWIKTNLQPSGVGWALVLDYSFTNLDADRQKTGREELNTLMTALHGIGLPVHLELGYV